MIGVITGDIINSQQSQTEEWLPMLKSFFETLGKTPKDWEIYRGDEFQLKTGIDEVFWTAMCIKALIKRSEILDVRLAIGIGDEQFSSEKITESNGTAYVNSGRLLNDLKNENRTFAIQTPDKNITEDLNMIFKWAIINFDAWTAVVSEVVFEMLLNKKITQDELAKQLNITQSSVSQRMKRSYFDLILETDHYYRKKIATL